MILVVVTFASPIASMIGKLSNLKHGGRGGGGGDGGHEKLAEVMFY